MQSRYLFSALGLFMVFFVALPVAAVEKADMVWIRKSQNEMLLMKDYLLMRRYSIGLGSSPVGHKQVSGDGRTPEGLYYIQTRNPNSRYHLALQISYPNQLDRQRATMRGKDPGGQIMIHGEPNSLRQGDVLKRNWTQGCIAVSNEEIREIWSMVDDETLVFIEP